MKNGDILFFGGTSREAAKIAKFLMSVITSLRVFRGSKPTASHAPVLWTVAARTFGAPTPLRKTMVFERASPPGESVWDNLGRICIPDPTPGGVSFPILHPIAHPRLLDVQRLHPEPPGSIDVVPGIVPDEEDFGGGKPHPPECRSINPGIRFLVTEV
ncbi:hypothetical protein L21_1795 [Methanoculleus chikugoensis]|uniref:Uncharacterized protein n=1 Tax=Methanoculleus chikugoensis TaxID=118126 RepID=A0A1M4MM61_9EURY|nr:hypothetical protein L21_1795 [Methanoculleus chikugoensis]